MNSTGHPRRSSARPGSRLLLALLLAAAPAAAPAGDLFRVVNGTGSGVRIGLARPGRDLPCAVAYPSGLRVERSFRRDGLDWWWVPQGATVRVTVGARSPYRLRGRLQFMTDTLMELDQARFALARTGAGDLAGRVLEDPAGRITLATDADGLVLNLGEAGTARD